MSELARVTTLEAIVKATKVRRKELGLSQLLVDEISGLQNGYTGKIEAGIKGLGKLSLPLLLEALQLELLVVPAARQHREEKAEKHEDFWSRKGREMRAKQLAKQTPKQRRKIARAAAKARWAKVRAESKLA